MPAHLIQLKGPAIIPHLEKIGCLRLSIFRDYPYLYEGSLSDEQQYLQAYVSSASSLVVLAMDAGCIIGASTCLKLDEADSGFKDPFLLAGYDTSLICYFGESVLLSAYRGQGIGKQFFNHRENHARDLGCTMSAFCAVDRPVNHARRPPDYRELDSFWQSQGYQKRPELKATFAWKEVGEAHETAKKLTFWTKELAPLNK